MFLYSTAYGRDFSNTLLEDYSSAPSEIFLLRGPDVVNIQGTMKDEIRSSLNVTNTRRNCLHMPDTLADTYANIACLFGGNYLVRLIRATVCAGGWR
jgi:hypothetical protein